MEEPSTFTSSQENKASPTFNQSRQCRICSDKSDGAHFGVDSCRACAAFFRRSIVLKKKYVCRQGGNSCNINKSVRCMCRKCRFVKCLQCGMLPENVHQRAEQAPPSEPSQPSPSSPAPTSTVIVHPPVPMMPSIKPISPLQYTMNTTTIPTELTAFSPPFATSDEILRPMPIRPSIVTDHCTLLKRINTNYNQMTALRRSSELALCPTNCVKSIFGGANGEIRSCTFGLLDRIMKAAVPIAADFCNTTFPDFARLEQDDKWILFRNFIGIIFHFECGLRTATNGLRETRKRQLTVTTYIDMERHEEFFTKSDPPIEISVEARNIVLDRSECPGAHRLLDLIYKLQMSDLEIAAFIGLCLWSPSISAVNEEVHAICVASREAIFRDLHSYYRYIMHLDEYAVRLGDLMGLFANIQTQTQKMREEMELFSLFDVFEKESFVYNLLKI